MCIYSEMKFILLLQETYGISIAGAENSFICRFRH